MSITSEGQREGGRGGERRGERGERMDGEISSHWSADITDPVAHLLPSVSDQLSSVEIYCPVMISYIQSGKIPLQTTASLHFLILSSFFPLPPLPSPNILPPSHHLTPLSHLPSLPSLLTWHPLSGSNSVSISSENFSTYGTLNLVLV